MWRQKICRWFHYQDWRQKPKEKEKVRVILAVWRVAPYNLMVGCLSGLHRHASVKIDFICMQTARSFSIKARVVLQKNCSFSVYVLCLMFYVLHQQQVRWHKIGNTPAFYVFGVAWANINLPPPPNTYITAKFFCSSQCCSLIRKNTCFLTFVVAC